MKQNVIIKANVIGIGIVLGILAAPSMAQDSPSSTIDTPSGSSYEGRAASDQPAYMQPLDARSWGNLPRTQRRDEPQPRGAMGPIRSGDDDMRASGSRWERTKSYMRQPVGNRGELGFLNWRENNTDTP